MSCLTSSAGIVRQFNRHSVFNVRKNRSATALSRQWPDRDMLLTMPFCCKRWRYSVLAYWLPLSEWWINPGSGFLRPIAICSAFLTSETAIVLSSAHPTILWEYRSMIIAKYNHPSIVLTYVISDTHIRLGFSVRNVPCIKFGETGYWWLLRVVILNRFLFLILISAIRINRRTRYRPIASPFFCSWCMMRRLP